MAIDFRTITSGRSSIPSVAPPNVEANLQAAATPLAVEPVAGRTARRRNLRQEQIDRLVAAGDDPETAAMVVDRLAEMNGGEISAELFDQYNTPAGNAALKGRIAEGRAADARMHGFENEYNAETGHPEYGYDASGNPARLGRVDIDKPDEATLRARGARRYQARAPHNAELEALNYGPGSDYAPAEDAPEYADSTVPGPRTLDGKSPTPSRGLTAEEAEAYNLRKPGQLSQRDRDMKERGFVPVVTPEGVRYMLQSTLFDGDILSPAGFNPPPGGVGRRGSRPDLTASSPKYPTGKYETRTEIGPDGNEVDVLVPTAQFKQQQSEVLANRLKSLAEERRNRRAQWQATAMLAGGSQNLNSGNRAIYNQAVQIADPAKRMEFLNQFRQSAGNYQSNDPRIQVAQIQAQAAKDNAAAERESRNSQNQWQAQHQAGIEERAAAARLHDAAMQRQFDAEQKQLDREHVASQGNAAREEASVARQAELDQRRMEHEERMAAEERRYQLMREESAAREKAAEQRHAETLEGMRSEREGRTAAAGATVDAARIGADAELAAAGAKRDSETERGRLGMELSMQEKSPGLYDIMTGNSSTEDAIRELKRIAKSADRFQWLPGGGFGLREATSMNDHLKRLQRQAEMMGIQTPLSDPNYRRELIKRWGYSSGWSGGRGGWVGDLLNPMPEDLQ